MAIIDRKKHIFKMAQGEYIAPEKIENIYIRSDFVSQCFVHGNGLKASLIAIVVPDEAVIPKLAKSKGVGGDIKEICSNEAVKKAILEDMVKVGKEAKLHNFEQVGVHFLLENKKTKKQVAAQLWQVLHNAMKAGFDVLIGKCTI